MLPPHSFLKEWGGFYLYKDYFQDVRLEAGDNGKVRSISMALDLIF